MFFPQPREPFPARICADLCVQPSITLASTTAKSLPLLNAMKKTVIPVTDPRLRLPASIVPPFGSKVYETQFHPNNRFVPDFRLWPQIDTRFVRLNGALAPPMTVSSPTLSDNGLVTRTPFFQSPFPHFDLRFAAPTNYGRKLFRCPQCRYVTDRRNNLKRHVLTMHQTCNKMLECCGIMFNTKASLREHSMIFHYNGYTCHFCGRRFCRKALLKRHLSVHSGQKDYICTVCDYATSHKSNLERHRKVHLRQSGDGDLDDSTMTSSDGESAGKDASKSPGSRDDIDFSSDDDSDWEINVVTTQDEEDGMLLSIDPNLQKNDCSPQSIGQKYSPVHHDVTNSAPISSVTKSNTMKSDNGTELSPQTLNLSNSNTDSSTIIQDTHTKQNLSETPSVAECETSASGCFSAAPINPVSPYNVLKIPCPTKRRYDVSFEDMPVVVNNNPAHCKPAAHHPSLYDNVSFLAQSHLNNPWASINVDHLNSYRNPTNRVDTLAYATRMPYNTMTATSAKTNVSSSND